MNEPETGRTRPALPVSPAVLAAAAAALAVAAAFPLVASLGRGERETATPLPFVQQALGGPVSASDPLVRAPRRDVRVRIGPAGYTVALDDGAVSIAAVGAGGGEWRHYRHGASRRTDFGIEAIAVGPSRTEELLTVTEPQGRRTWRWRLSGQRLAPRILASGSVELRASAQPVRLSPVRILDAAGRDVSPPGLRWSLSRRGGTYFLELPLDDRRLPLPYVIDPAANYPTPLNLRSTPASVTGSWTLDGGTGAVDTSTSNLPGQNDTGWYAWDPGASVTDQLAALPGSPDGRGWLVDPAGGAGGFPAGTWSFTVKTDIPDNSLTAGAAVLAVGVWKGAISGGAFTPTATILAPADDPAGQNLRTATTPVTTTVTFSLPKLSLGAGETLYVDLWRHQTQGIASGNASRRQLDLYVNDGAAGVAHPAADDTGPAHALSVTAVSGSTHLSGSTLWYNGGAAGSLRLGDALTDAGSGPYSVTYPAVGAPGWTHPAETVTAGPAFQSSLYSWTAGSTTAPGAQAVVGEDSALQTSTATLTIANDVTPPSGHSVALAGGPWLSSLSVPLTLGGGSDSGAGVNAASSTVERASATLSAGSCGGFGAYASVALVGGADSTVSSGSCYRYRHRLADNVGNEAASDPSGDAKVDASAPAAPGLDFSALTSASASGSTVWYRPGTSGGFTVTASATDAQSGIASYTFPAFAGWTVSGSGASRAYAYSGTPVEPGDGRIVTAANGAGLESAAATFAVKADATPPAGQYVALAGDSSWYSTRSVPLTVFGGTDSGSGLDAASGAVERSSAALSNGVCGTFGAFTAAVLAGGADTGVAPGFCYRYRYRISDRVGNRTPPSPASAEARIDDSAPAAPALSFSGFSSAAVSGTTVWYRPGADGAFTVTAGAADPQSGIASTAFPGFPGWTASGSGSGRTYTYTGTPPEPGPGRPVTVTNNAGLASAPATFAVVADAAPPTATIACNGRPCASGVYAAPLSVTLVASDAGGSGVERIRYTVDGSEPTRLNGSDYLAPLAVERAVTVKYRAYDRVGNEGALLTAAIRTAPAAQASFVFLPPARVSTSLTAHNLVAQIQTTARAKVTATLRRWATGKIVSTWRFTAPAGRTTARLRVPPRVRKPGRYTLVWTATARGQTIRRTTRVEFLRKKP